MNRFATVALAAGAAIMPMKWAAKLASESGSTIVGTATVEPGKDAKSTHATVMITGGEPGATYPWHVHEGKCADHGKVVGPATAYTPLKAGKDGSAKVDVTLPYATPDDGSFAINVHKSPSDLGTIVACGELGMAGM